MFFIKIFLLEENSVMIKGKKKVATSSKTAKASTAKKVTVAPRKKSAISEKLTKAQTIKFISEESGLTAKEVKVVFTELQNLLHRSIAKQGCGEFVVPELGIKVRRIKKQATKKRMGRNPFTGQEIVIPAKPAREAIKVVAMKALKEALK
jgi:nucleoid DNA-binding protein